MSRPGRGCARAGTVLAVVLAAVLLPAAGAAAHPLGNFTVNTADRVLLTAAGVEVQHVVDLAEVPTVQLRATADLDGDGALDDAELATTAEAECARVAPAVEVLVDGARVPAELVTARAQRRDGEAGLSTTRITCELVARERPTDSVQVLDRASEGRTGWREVTAQSFCGRLTASDVPEDSPSGLLTAYPDDLLSSPVDVRGATLSVDPGGACGDGPGAAADAVQLLPRALDPITRAYEDFLSRTALTVPVALAALVLSVVLGAGHALAPGHGKTVMAAYLVGQHGSRRQAVWLGATVTLTHTLGVLVLGAVLTLSTLAAPERVVPVTEVLSGLLLAVVGLALLVRAVRRRSTADHDHDHDHDHDDASGHSADGPGADGPGADGPGADGHGADGHGGEHRHGDHGHGDHGHDHPHSQGHDHRHDQGDDPAHDHSHDNAHGQGHDRPESHGHDDPGEQGAAALPVSAGVAVLEHAHGGRTHSHAPIPGRPLSWRWLAAMGVAGGLVPSPAALVVLLAATASGRAWFGALLVVGYGVGMALTLTVAGLLLLRAQASLDRRGWVLARTRRLGRLLPVLTALVVVVVGVALVVRGAVTAAGLG